MRLTLACLLVVLASLAGPGCLQVEEQPFLSVRYEATNGTVIETHQDGELVERQPAVLVFDFSQTLEQIDVVAYGVQVEDGIVGVEVEADGTGSVEVTFAHHGLHVLLVHADVAGERLTKEVTVRIELVMHWAENGTNDPLPATVQMMPRNGGSPPVALNIESTVENPGLIDNFGGGQEVEVRWSLEDETHGVCQTNRATVQDNDAVTWRTAHFSSPESHELRVAYEAGQDAVNVHHRLEVLHEAIETVPSGQQQPS